MIFLLFLIIINIKTIMKKNILNMEKKSQVLLNFFLMKLILFLQTIKLCELLYNNNHIALTRKRAKAMAAQEDKRVEDIV